MFQDGRPCHHLVRIGQHQSGERDLARLIHPSLRGAVHGEPPVLARPTRLHDAAVFAVAGHPPARTHADKA